MYLDLLAMLCALALAADLRQRLRQFWEFPFSRPLVAMLAWTLIAALAGSWFDDTPTRLFHVARVALVLCLGSMLTRREASLALRGFLSGAVLAALVVACHHVWALPDWAIWSSLLRSRNNFSSGNMISMATAAAIFFLLGLRAPGSWKQGWPFLAAALALSLTVGLHAVSRNALLLVVVLLAAVLVYRYRSFKAMAGGAAAVVVLALAIWQMSPTVQTRFESVATDLAKARQGASYATSVGLRWRMWQEALQGMGEDPVLGTGVGSWLPRWHSVWTSLHQDLPEDANRTYSTINNPHNDFLLTGMETGVAGLIILAWLCASFIRAGWRASNRPGGVLLVLGVAVVATAAVNAPFRDAALGMTLLWLLGAGMALTKAGQHE